MMSAMQCNPVFKSTYHRLRQKDGYHPQFDAERWRLMGCKTA